MELDRFGRRDATFQMYPHFSSSPKDKHYGHYEEINRFHERQ
jgi:hypothetical protein